MRHLVPFVVLAMACAEVAGEASLATDLAAPGFSVLLGGAQTSSEGPYAFRGEEVSFLVRGAPARKLVGVAVALSEQTDGYCPSEVAPSCLDLGTGATLLGTTTTGGAGGASLDVVVPHRTSFSEVFAQAAYLSRGSLVSTGVTRLVVLDRTDDDDGDSLENIEEKLLGTDPFLPDTDGDGFLDADEVSCGSSPTDSLDFCAPS